MVSAYTLNYIFRFQLKEWLEYGLFMFYFFTAGIGPTVLGYCFGRWMPFYVRAIPLIVILWVCLKTGKTSLGHGFEIYAFGNLIYAYFCRRGLKRKAEKLNVAFEDLSHFDWMIAVIATFLIPLILWDW